MKLSSSQFTSWDDSEAYMQYSLLLILSPDMSRILAYKEANKCTSCAMPYKSFMIMCAKGPQHKCSHPDVARTTTKARIMNGLRMLITISYRPYLCLYAQPPILTVVNGPKEPATRRNTLIFT